MSSSDQADSPQMVSSPHIGSILAVLQPGDHLSLVKRKRMEERRMEERRMIRKLRLPMRRIGTTTGRISMMTPTTRTKMVILQGSSPLPTVPLLLPELPSTSTTLATVDARR